MTLLITCFEPFGGANINPTQKIVELLPDSYKDEMEIHKVSLPVSKDRSVKMLKGAIELYEPSAVLSLGLGGGRKTITVEKRGANLDDFPIPDNDGVAVSNQKIVPEGPDELLSTLPVDQIVSDMNRSGVPCALSDSAGRYICNHVLYSALYLSKTEQPSFKAGFIHVPFLPEQVKNPKTPSMELGAMVKGIESAIKTIYEDISK